VTILGLPILSFLVFFPLVGAGLLALVPKSAEKSIKWFAFAISVIEFAASLPLYFNYKPSVPGMQFEEFRPWLTGSARTGTWGSTGSRSSSCC
jgi:NADH-quinone oxidoreductase subunit M